MTDQDLDFDLFPSPASPPVREAVPASVVVATKTGPRSLNRSDVAVAEADNRRARRPRSR